jgi:3-hydroxyacyl-[acyl-carrier-protein] dehydratase
MIGISTAFLASKPTNASRVAYGRPEPVRFYLVDRVLECEPGVRALGVKSVALSEDFFEQHFSGIPVMPGTMILEGMAQLSGYLLARTLSPAAPHKHKAILSMVERAKFLRPVQPGSCLRLESRILKVHEDSAKCDCEATVDGETVGSARLMFTFRTLENDLLEANRQQTFAIWTTGSSQPIGSGGQGDV